MNYLKIYINLIRKAQRENLNLEHNIERHHVFPVSIFGNNNFVVKLTYRQHFIAHLLLKRICEKRYGIYHPYTRKMNMAVHRMVYTTLNRRIHTSFAYSIARKACSDAKRALKLENDEKRKNGIPIVAKYSKKKYNKRVIRSLESYWIEATERVRNNTIPKNIKQVEYYDNMSNKEFENWIDSVNLMVDTIRKGFKTKKPNPNVIKACMIRKIPLKTYYSEKDFSKAYFQQKIHQVMFYGL